MKGQGKNVGFGGKDINGMMSPQENKEATDLRESGGHGGYGVIGRPNHGVGKVEMIKHPRMTIASTWWYDLEDLTLSGLQLTP